MKKVIILIFLILIIVLLPSFGQKFINPFSSSDLLYRIWLNVRVPRVLTGFIAGGNLAVSGYVLQNILLNPLATPYTLGVSTGASVGLLFSVLFFQISVFGYLFAFIGAVLGVFLTIFVARKGDTITVTNLILAGVIVNILFSSVILLFYLFAPPELSIRILHWLIGSLDTFGFSGVMILAVISLPFLIFLLFFYRELDILVLGEEQALSLGVNYKKFFIFFVIVVTIITSVTVSETGPIGFVGLIIPHSLRILKINKAFYSLPINFLMGGFFLAITDTIARVIIPSANLPVGIITSFLGGIFFLILLKKT